MTFAPKAWVNEPNPATPVSAAGLIDLEARLAAYTDVREAVAKAYTDTREAAIRVGLITNLYNVKDYGAVGNGVADDRGAIQAAIDAAFTTRGMVYIPASPNPYLIGNALKLHKSTHIWGTHAPAWMPTISDRTTRLKAKAGFTDTAMIQIWDKTLTVDAEDPDGGSLRGLCLDGAGIAIDGVYWRGSSFDWTIENVEVTACTQYGFLSEGYNPGSGYHNQQELNFWHCHAWSNGLYGFGFNDHSYDHRLVGCVAHGNGIGNEGGYLLNTGCASIEFVSCRSEWNIGHGFLLLSGDKVSLHGCVTDSNSANGVYISYTAGGPMLLSGCFANRDTVAGVRVHNSNIVVIDALTERTGENDGGGGAGPFRPVYGVDVTGTSKALIQGYLSGVTAGYHTDGNGAQVVKFSGTTGLVAGSPPSQTTTWQAATS
jgi:hypothetical protein